jgi:hypothetical protein
MATQINAQVFISWLNIQRKTYPKMEQLGMQINSLYPTNDAGNKKEGINQLNIKVA